MCMCVCISNEKKINELESERIRMTFDAQIMRLITICSPDLFTN